MFNLFIGRPAYVEPEEWERVRSQRWKLYRTGLPWLGSAGMALGLGVFALIFEIAADAFSVAAYQTLLALYGAEGIHWIAIGAFAVLSFLLLLGVVPSYQAASYIQPNVGGSGPLVESIAPQRPITSWIARLGTSLFLIDAVLTVVISSLSAADVILLVVPQMAPYRLGMAISFAALVMMVLFWAGPRRAVLFFLIGGAAFTIFTAVALSITALAALLYPQWAALTPGIVLRLVADGVITEVVSAPAQVGRATLLALFFISMSSAMLGFSGYEVIPASGKHAARPKWFVVREALILAAGFLIVTGMMQLWAAYRWQIPATEGYSTLLVEYEIVATQWLGRGVDPTQVTVTPEVEQAARELWAKMGEEFRREWPSFEAFLEEEGPTVALSLAIVEAQRGPARWVLALASLLLAGILLLAQGGGYVGGAAVAANAARLGRLPRHLSNDKWGVLIIGLVSMALIPMIREVTRVEAYYAFGFVSAFVISSYAVKSVRDEVLRERGIDPKSPRARALRMAGWQGLIASSIMLIVLVFTKWHALPAIVLGGGALLLLQWWYSRKMPADPYALARKIARRGGLEEVLQHLSELSLEGVLQQKYSSSLEWALDNARQRGIAQALEEMLIRERYFYYLNINHDLIRNLIAVVFRVEPRYFHFEEKPPHIRNKKVLKQVMRDAWAVSDEFEIEPSDLLQYTHRLAYNRKQEILETIQYFVRFGVFTFIRNYHDNWVNLERGRPPEIVQQAMLKILFHDAEFAEIWEAFQQYRFQILPQDLWDFARERYNWAKLQWSNLSGKLTTVWVMQDYGLMPLDLVVPQTVKLADRPEKTVYIYTSLAALPKEPNGDPFVAYMLEKYSFVLEQE